MGRTGSGRESVVASIPTTAAARATEAVASRGSRTTDAAEVARVARRTTTATASRPTRSAVDPAAADPTTSESATGTDRTTVRTGRVGSPPAHQPASARTPRKPESTHPVPPATTGANAAAPATMSTASSSLDQRRASQSPASATPPERSSPAGDGTQP